MVASTLVRPFLPLCPFLFLSYLYFWQAAASLIWAARNNGICKKHQGANLEQDALPVDRDSPANVGRGTFDGGRCKAGPWVKFFEPASAVPPQLSSPVRAFPPTISALAPSPLAFLVVQSVLTWCPCKNRSNTRGDFWPCQAAKGSINGFS